MASVVFLPFFQTQFANLEFVHVVTCPLSFLTLKRYISVHNVFSVLGFENLYGNFHNDFIPIFWRPSFFAEKLFLPRG